MAKINKKQALTRLKNGEVVAIPTETVYGLAADIQNGGALSKIFAIKNRPADNPLIVHIGSEDQLKEIALKVDDVSRTLIDKYWPGPLTLILPAQKHISPTVTVGLDTVGIRMPASRKLRAILKRGGIAVAAPSANPSGKPSATSAEMVESYFGSEFPVLRGGVSKNGIESTVVRVEGEQIQILRKGALGIGQIQVDFPEYEVVFIEGERSSPGTRYRHYAPNAGIVIASQKVWTDFQSDGKSIGFIGFKWHLNSKMNYQFSLGRNAKTAMKNLYKGLHAFDETAVSKIMIHEEVLEASDILRDRIEKASASNA